jgi:hypothetical protein
MNWRLLTWKDWFEALLAAALAGTLLLYYLMQPGVGRPGLDANFGFGPDWVCKNPGTGEPVCVKKQPSN